MDFNLDFERTLKKMYNKMIPDDFPRSETHIDLNDYEFENINVVLIPSYPGKYTVDNRSECGIYKIDRVVQSLIRQK